MADIAGIGLEGVDFTLGDLLGYIKDKYPSMLPFLGKPGVWDLMVRVLHEGAAAWPDPRLQEAFRETEYARTTTKAQQQWDFLTWTSPADALEQGNQAARMVEDMTRQLGINIDGAAKFDLAAKVVTNQWDASRLKYELLTSWWVGGTGAASGPIASAAAQYRKMGAEFGLKVTDDAAIDWGRRIAAGQNTIEDAREGLRYFAETTYPGIAEFIHQGGTVADFAQPYLQLASTELGIPTSAMPLDDPKWSGLFLGDDGKGNQGVLSYAEAQKKLRSDDAYGYNYSPGATKQAASFATNILDMFGFARQ